MSEKQKKEFKVMYVRIGDYEVSIILFLIIGAVIIVVCGALYFFLRKGETRTSSVKGNYNAITKWQKEKLVLLIEEDVKSAEEVTDTYIEVTDRLQAYIRRQRFWDRDDISEIHPYALSILSSILLDNINYCILNKKNNNAVLLLQTLDYVNGGAPYLNGRLDWLGEDLEEKRNHPSMSDYEARLLKIFEEGLAYVYEDFDEELDKIPEKADVPEELKQLDGDDFNSMFNELEECVDVSELKSETKRVISLGLNEKVQRIILTLDEELKYYNLYYVRALACATDPKYTMYEDILESIDFS